MQQQSNPRLLTGVNLLHFGYSESFARQLVRYQSCVVKGGIHKIVPIEEFTSLDIPLVIVILGSDFNKKDDMKTYLSKLLEELNEYQGIRIFVVDQMLHTHDKNAKEVLEAYVKKRNNAGLVKVMTVQRDGKNDGQVMKICDEIKDEIEKKRISM